MKTIICFIDICVFELTSINSKWFENYVFAFWRANLISRMFSLSKSNAHINKVTFEIIHYTK